MYIKNLDVYISIGVYLYGVVAEHVGGPVVAFCYVCTIYDE